MRFLLLLIAFQSLTAQTVKRAVFASCKDDESPYECSDEKQKTDIEKLISGSIADEIRKSPDSAYFSVNYAFISDEKGMVSPESIETISNSESLNSAIREYIKHLPPFYPKNNGSDELRTAHILQHTMIFDKDSGKYRLASDEETKALNIKPDITILGNPPILEECGDAAQPYKCSLDAIYKIVGNEYRIHKFKGPSRKVRLVASYIIEKDGSMTIEDITCSEDNKQMIREYRRVLKSLPKFVPANYKGVLVRVRYSLPVSLEI